MERFIEIDGRRIGPGFPTYLVAEISANHHQKFDEAVRLIHAAKEAGADAVKLQTYTPDTITIQSDREYFRIAGGTPWDGRTLYDLYREAFTPWEWQPKLKAIADASGDRHCFRRPLILRRSTFWKRWACSVHKIASFEIVDIPLIEKMARTGKPLIISTGMATLEEIEEAVQAARHSGATELALLKCTSAYPAPPEEMNLQTIPHLAETFQIPVGTFRSHVGSGGSGGGCDSRGLHRRKTLHAVPRASGPDSAFSLEPQEFKARCGVHSYSRKSPWEGPLWSNRPGKPRAWFFGAPSLLSEM